MSEKSIGSIITAGSNIAGVQSALNPADTGCNDRKDFPHSLTRSSADAAKVARPLPAARGFLVRNKSHPPKRNFPGERPRIGVFVCSCGVGITGVIDVDLVAAYAKTLAHVIWAENNLFTCSADTRVLIARRIGENNLNRIVIAACTPPPHEPIFQEMLLEAGLYANLVTMADIRHQYTSVHQKEPELATELAMDQVRLAVQNAVRGAPQK